MASYLTRIFVSYARKDGAELGKRLYEELTKLGFEVWFDTRSLIPGTTWDREIEAALRMADVVLAILTPGFENSETCRDEINFAKSHGKWIIPLLTSAKTSALLALDRLQRIDFSRKAKYKASLAELIAALSKFAPPAPAIEGAFHVLARSHVLPQRRCRRSCRAGMPSTDCAAPWP